MIIHKAYIIGQDPMKDYAMNSLQGSVPNMAAYDVYSAFGTDSDDSGEVFSTETYFTLR